MVDCVFFGYLTFILVSREESLRQRKVNRKIEERKQARTKAEATKGEQHHKAVINSRGSIGKHG